MRWCNPKDVHCVKVMTCWFVLQGVQQLIRQGADVNARSNDGMTPLAIASFWGYADIVKLLLEKGSVYILGHYVWPRSSEYSTSHPCTSHFVSVSLYVSGHLV